MTRFQLQILILVCLLLQAGIGLIIQGALTAAFLAASFFLKPKTKISSGKGASIPIQNSDYGGMIPIIYGVARVGGNIVWASELRKTIETETVGGKGLGGGQKVENPVFDVDLAVMIAKGTVSDIRRIWADGKTIFDKTGASEITSSQELNFRLLGGDPNQEPDSLIQTDVDGRLGVGSTPAYRGRSIVIFEKLLLKDFGNRVPNLSFEIVADNNGSISTTPTALVQEGSIFTKNTNQSVTHPDWDRGLLFMGGDGGFGSDPLRTAVTTISTKQLLRVLSIRDSDGGGAVDPATGDVVSKTQASAEISRWDPITGVIKAQANLGIGAFQGGKNYCHNPNSFPVSTVFFGKMRTTVLPTEFRYQIIDTEINLIASVDRPDSTYVLTTPTASKDGSSYAAFVNTTEMRLFALGLKSSNLQVSVLPTFQVPPLPAAGQGFVNFGLLETLTPSTFGGSLFDTTVTPAIAYDRGSGDILIFFTMDTKKWASRYTPGTGVVWISEMPFLPTDQCAAHSRITGKTFGFISDDQKLALLDISTGLLDPIFNGVDTVTNLPIPSINIGEVHMYFWDEKTFSFYGTPDTVFVVNSRVSRIRLDISSSSPGTSLADIVSDISVEAGYEIISDYDVSELTGLSVPGYPLLEQQTARDAIQPLSDIYFFDGIESDDKLRYRTRGRSSSASLTEDGLIEINSDGQLFGRTRVQEAELPRSVQITSSDPQNSYQQATQQAARVGFPNPTNRSNNQESISSPLTLDQDFARQSAEKLLYSAWNDRNGYEFRTSWEFLILDPSDVLTITFDDGFSTDVRLEEANSGTDFSIEIKGVGQGPGQYLSSILGETSNSLQVTIPSVENSQLFLLDVPLLQDVDAPSSGIARMYWAGNSINPIEWVGGLLYESDNLSTFQVSGATNKPASWGVIINSLPPPVSPWSWDTVNTINLVVQSGIDNFSSSTDDLVLAGANAIALIRDGASRQVEIIQFVNVVVETDGTLTLSRLLRGRRGTEVFGETNHVAGQKVVLLTTSAVNSYLDPASEVSNPHFYRLVTTGQNFADISNVSYTPDGRSLRPYAPTQQTAVTNGSDIDLVAVRRTRLNGELTDGTGVVPLNEDSEQYELEILDMPGGSVLRTIIALSTPFYKYLSADITTDFGSPPANLTLKWYQVSASVGRGFTSEVTIEVA